MLDLLANRSAKGVVHLDNLTYAINLATLHYLSSNARHVFVRGGIVHDVLAPSLLKKHSIRAVVNDTTQSHMDRSIHDLGDFI